MLVRITGRLDIRGREARRLKRSLSKMMRKLAPGKNFELSIAFLGEEEIRRLNREYRSVDEDTDVISFPQMSHDEIANSCGGGMGQPAPLGDIGIGVDVARRQAAERGHPAFEEIELLAAHGLLHLFGYDHGNLEGSRAMAAAERMLVGKSMIEHFEREN